VVLFGLGLSAYAQEISWEIKQHSTDIDDLEAEVTEYMESGYVPVGISYDNVELYILYVHDPSVEASAWSIEWYDSTDTLQAGITEYMNDGYIPHGITYTGELFYVLYIQMENSADAWLLIPSSQNLPAVEKAIQPDVSQGYVPMGIATYKGEYWTLLVRIPGTTIKRWSIESYKVGSHADLINAAIEQGYLPWGLTYNSKTGRIDILYVGF
jgi:hypothetical protein